MSWYRTGTVTLTNGTPNVIGAGTAWLAAKAEAGDAITLPDGRDYEIQAVGSDTSITLTSAYLGASVAGAVYQIKPIATAARLIELSSQAAQLLQTFADVAQRAGVGKFAAGALVDNVLRPSLRGLIDDDTGINLPGNNVIEQWQGGVKTSSVAADGAPSGAMWQKAPISAAVAAVLASMKSYRAFAGGVSDSILSPNWFSIGVVSLNQSDAARITVLGTQGYSDGADCAGEAVILLRGTNNLAGVGISGVFYGVSNGAWPLREVAVVRINGGQNWRVLVRNGLFASLTAYCDTSGAFTPESVDTGQADLPAGAVPLKSIWRLFVEGAPVLKATGNGLEIEAGGLRQGPLAPRTAKKLLTGNMFAAGQNTISIPHGLASSNIVGVQVFASRGGGTFAPPNLAAETIAPARLRYSYLIDAANIVLVRFAGEATELEGAPVSILVEYLV